jgi:S-adenosylmethionine-diacylglycerol 3-amino-3-carboxypropyl transferase
MEIMMTSKSLIDDAVFNSSTSGSKGFADRLFAHWFSRLVYAQIWEDPQSDIDALQLKPGANILTISSGGCNALAYLSTDPAAVHAVDLNGAHLAMLEMKKQAIKHLPDYDSVLHFLGNANQADNIKRYQRHIRPNLSQDASDFWESRSILGKFGKPRFHYFSKNAYQHGLLGDFIGLAHGLVRFMGGDLKKLATARSMEEQVSLFETYLAPVFENKLFQFLARQPIALYSLGIPPSQFAALKHDAKQGLPNLFKERMRHLACDFPLDQNCFAHQAFARCYDTNTQTALPMYLQKRYFSSLRNNIDRIYPHHTNLTDFLRQQPRASMDAYLFLDAQDWMDKRQLTELWEQVSRTAAPEAKVVFRTGGSESPLEKMLPPQLLSAWHTDTAHNRRLYASDRSAIYGGMHLYIKNTAL